MIGYVDPRMVKQLLEAQQERERAAGAKKAPAPKRYRVCERCGGRRFALIDHKAVRCGGGDGRGTVEVGP